MSLKSYTLLIHLLGKSGYKKVCAIRIHCHWDRCTHRYVCTHSNSYTQPEKPQDICHCCLTGRIILIGDSFPSFCSSVINTFSTMIMHFIRKKKTFLNAFYHPNRVASSWMLGDGYKRWQWWWYSRTQKNYFSTDYSYGNWCELEINLNILVYLLV